MALILGVVDQSPIRQGGSPGEALDETLRLARACDALGYHRYWLAEHHNSGGLASASPEVLIPLVAHETRRLRVGSGGVMLTHYASLKVAEQFRLLTELFPNRIDLGVGRAPGSDMRTARALSPLAGPAVLERYPQQVSELVALLTGGLPPNHPLAGVQVTPPPFPDADGSISMPEIWLLGSSTESAEIAAEQGLAMAQYNLGFMYAAGRGVEPDVTEAAKWYWLAAEQGMPVAQFNLATLFLSPRSMPQDLINAYMWLEVATALGYMKAAEYRDAVAVRMNPGDITTAETMARKWLEEHE